MQMQHKSYTVRSLSPTTKARLVALKAYSRLTYGSLIDDAVEALWNDYITDGHPLPEPRPAPVLEATR